MNRTLLPTGHHWDLHIERARLPDAGTFTGGGWKLCFHTTQSPWNAVDAMYETLKAKNAASTVLIGGRPGVKHPVVIQMIPFNRAARALANDQSDGFQTNRANVIQIEWCGYTEQIPNWNEWDYRALANLVELIRHRVPIRNAAPQDFSDPRRMTDREWVEAEGYVNHRMCPDNNHVDGFRLREGHLINLIDDCPSGGYDL